MIVDAGKYLTENRGLIESLASKFYLATSKFSRDDLVQEASLAAIRALNKFDPKKNKSKLSTYVYSAVHRSCRDFVRRNKHDLYKTGYHQTQDWKEAQKNPVEIIEGPIPVGQFASTTGPMAVRADIAGEDGATFTSTIPSGEPMPLDALIIKEQFEILHEEINKLPPRERDIIKARFFEDRPLADIAREQDVTRQRINQIRQRAFKRISASMEDRLGDEILI